ncbi:MAG TPA: cytochrome c-type biogenesis protein [Rhizomicrobium sp.]|jgi:cytochrome c-type biogenesis protein CcmH|nr:cytochrome c-type biogenesis protein [Rhizomicrobium sp.]
MKFVHTLLLFWLFVTPAFAVPAPETFADPAMEARARHLQRELRCLVCQGESIDESGADLAADLRHLVREQMAEGRTDRQIKDYLVARYGDFILMQPPVKPDTWLLWSAPFLVLVGAGGVATWTIRRAQARARASEEPRQDQYIS